MEFEKTTYTINEVSEMLQINTSTLRNYEKEFDLKVPRDERNRRFYTEKEMEILKLIKQGRDDNHSIDTIKTALIKHNYIAEQRENGLSLTPVNNLTVEELQEVVFSQLTSKLADLVIAREQELKQSFEEKLVAEMSKLEDNIRNEIKDEFERHQIQLQQENAKLISYIQETRKEPEKKSLWTRLFNK